jgi:hypothetical protein
MDRAFRVAPGRHGGRRGAIVETVAMVQANRDLLQDRRLNEEALWQGAPCVAEAGNFLDPFFDLEILVWRED